MDTRSSGGPREPRHPNILQAYTTTLHVDGGDPLSLLMITTDLVMEPSRPDYVQDKLDEVLQVARLARTTGLFDSVAVCSVSLPAR